MKKLTTTMLSCGILASYLLPAYAAPTLRVSGDGGTTWTIVEDNGPLDQNSAVGAIFYSGPVGDWALSLSSGQGAPFIGSLSAPDMDLSTINVSSKPATLIAQFCETNLNTFASETYILNTAIVSGGSVNNNVYRDSANILFGSTASYVGDPAGISPSPTASLLMTAAAGSGTSSSSNGVVYSAVGNTPNSLTLETIVTHTGAGSTQVDAHLFALSQPACSCALTFNSPTSITNCAGDTIPDVVASQDCGTGPISVPVTLVGAATNGSCPKIITRTNSATDSCGGVHTFVQTITVNCLPDCKITPSVTNAVVGCSNYTASVASAGPGATYLWYILNGSITAGQGTTNITWAAGTDTNSPITIVVTVTSAAGCQSTCSASVRLSPKPPQISLSGGDTATIGFWHNKNGQALILSAPNQPALGNWLASTFPCMFGTLAGKSNSVVAALFLTDFGVKGQKTYAQVLAGAFAVYFTSSNLAGNGAAQYGFNVTPGGTGAKVFNVGALGTTIGLQNNTSYTVLQILQAANSKCPFGTSGAVFDALNTIFDGINTTGDIN